MFGKHGGLLILVTAFALEKWLYTTGLIAVVSISIIGELSLSNSFARKKTAGEISSMESFCRNLLNQKRGQNRNYHYSNQRGPQRILLKTNISIQSEKKKNKHKNKHKNKKKKIKKNIYVIK